MTLRYRIAPELGANGSRTFCRTSCFVRIIEAHSGLSGLVAATARLETA